VAEVCDSGRSTCLPLCSTLSGSSGRAVKDSNYTSASSQKEDNDVFQRLLNHMPFLQASYFSICCEKVKCYITVL
jgi:hypothetical protein